MAKDKGGKGKGEGGGKKDGRGREREREGVGGSKRNILAKLLPVFLKEN